MSQSDTIRAAPAMEEVKDAPAENGEMHKSDGSEHSQDPEKQQVQEMPELKRKLKARHLQMIAIGISP
jgi:amino acid permease